MDAGVEVFAGEEIAPSVATRDRLHQIADRAKEWRHGAPANRTRFKRSRGALQFVDAQRVHRGSHRLGTFPSADSNRRHSSTDDHDARFALTITGSPVRSRRGPIGPFKSSAPDRHRQRAAAVHPGCLAKRRTSRIRPRRSRAARPDSSSRMRTTSRRLTRPQERWRVIPRMRDARTE